MQTVEDLSFSLISVFEGYKPYAYKDSGGRWTIGLGHTGPEVKEGLLWTLPQIISAYNVDTHLLVQAVATLTLGNVAKAAAISFGYNCGLQKLLNVLSGKDSINNPAHTTDERGIILSGLVTRRRLEYVLYTS